MVFNYNQKKMSKKERETEDGKAVCTYERKGENFQQWGELLKEQEWQELICVERRGQAQRWELRDPAYSSCTHSRTSSCPPNAGSFSFQVEGIGSAAVEAETKQVTSTQADQPIFVNTDGFLISNLQMYLITEIQ